MLLLLPLLDSLSTKKAYSEECICKRLPLLQERPTDEYYIFGLYTLAAHGQVYHVFIPWAENVADVSILKS